MSEHDNDTCPHLVRASLLEAENARLKAEVERLTKAHSDALADFWAIHKGYFDLKAEVERLRASSFVTAVPVEQYERLLKAGDALYESEIGYYGEQILENMKHHSGELCRNWNAAKEGKQP
jgi:uncharacterized small protein (DUF1192 family)